MRKKIILICIILIIPLLMISCKKNEESSPVMLNSVDINAISSKDLLSVINDTTLDEGVYLIQTKSNKYVYFNGIKNKYVDITSSLKDRTFTINSNTQSSGNDNVNKKLYLIKENNTTSTDMKSQFYDTIDLIINNKSSSFVSIINFD